MHTKGYPSRARSFQGSGTQRRHSLANTRELAATLDRATLFRLVGEIKNERRFRFRITDPRKRMLFSPRRAPRLFYDEIVRQDSNVRLSTSCM